MERTRNNFVGEINPYKIFLRNLKARDQTRDLLVDGKLKK
jgi:hypothetical protein